eukprot:UN00440
MMEMKYAVFDFARAFTRSWCCIGNIEFSCLLPCSSSSYHHRY